MQDAGDLLAHQLARRERKFFVRALIVQGEDPFTHVRKDYLLAVQLDLEHGARGHFI